MPIATADRLAAVETTLLERLGFRDDDLRDLTAVAERVARDPAATELVDRLASGLRDGIGDIAGEQDPFAAYGPEQLREEADRDWGTGVLPMLALVITAEDVAAFHAGRGIDPGTSWTTLSDLGQQAWVHRRTFSGFGLHTFGWMWVAWSGALYWLGRLQFNLTRYTADGAGGQEWVLSTHIAESGPLTPQAVADSFGRARVFFAEHFPDYPTRLFHCDSWLLDPQLAQVLPAEANMVRFQQLWQLRGEGRTGDADAIFFVFRRRGDVDLDTLPQDTSLQRAIVERIAAGGHWQVCQGVFEQSRFAPVPDPAGPDPAGLSGSAR